MAIPHFPEARSYYQSAWQRFEDGQILLRNDRGTGAIYLAGYGVECILKALILNSIASENERRGQLAEFRGARAHNFDWLRRLYHQHGGPDLPPEVRRALVYVNTWETELRYQPGLSNPREAGDFMKETNVILNWADGRI